MVAGHVTMRQFLTRVCAIIARYIMKCTDMHASIGGLPEFKLNFIIFNTSCLRLNTVV